MIRPGDHPMNRVMDGSDRSAVAAMLRCGAACAEPFYALAVRLRNAMFESGVLAAHRLGRAVVGVGNLTTGGTGKTPIVAWLAQRLAAAAMRPAVLLRGYKSTPDGISDEADVLRGLLGPDVPVLTNPDRLAAATVALRQDPRITVFILDDAMQHRRAARDFELVLLHAGQPFGYGHLLPRGLLREPIDSLKRADAIVITHADQVTEADLTHIEGIVCRHNASAPIFRANHVIDAFRGADGELHPPQFLQGKPLMAFCGIACPQDFHASLGKLGGQIAATQVFADHHHYTGADLAQIQARAAAAGAQILVTTEKDWAKVSRLPAPALPISRAQLSLRFWQDHEQRLLELIRKSLLRAT